jgi:hypothetical protein
MQLKCHVCGVEEDFHFEGDVIAFNCGATRVQTMADLGILFKKWGGER